MARDYDRYELVRNRDGSLDQLPFIVMTSSTSDKYVEWFAGKSRMDKLAVTYYGSSFFDWVILYANPEWISEFDIPDGATIRIPFPLDRAIAQYQKELTRLRSQ